MASTSEAAGMRPHRQLSSELKDAAPRSAEEEEIQLQLALAMSKEENESERRKRKQDDVRLAIALNESKVDNYGAGTSAAASSSFKAATSDDTLLSLFDGSMGETSGRKAGSEDPWAPSTSTIAQTHKQPSAEKILTSSHPHSISPRMPSLQPPPAKHRPSMESAASSTGANDPWSTNPAG